KATFSEVSMGTWSLGWSSSRIPRARDSLWCGRLHSDSGSLVDLGAAPDAERVRLLCHRFPVDGGGTGGSAVEVAVVDRCRRQRGVVQATAETELLSPVVGRVHHDRSLVTEVAVPNVDRLVRGEFEDDDVLIVCGRLAGFHGLQLVPFGFVD